MTDKYAKLREVAEKATPGPWDVWREPTETRNAAIDEFTDQVMMTDEFAGAVFLLNANGKCPASTGCGPTSEANAAYIAAANPQTVLALLDERDSLRRMLFPYADAKEISGISFDGKYLIGDKASISYFHEMMNRGLQIDVYARAYDERIAAAEATIATLTAERDALIRERDEAREEAFIAGWERSNSGFGTLDPVHEYDEYRSTLSGAKDEREG